jgi:hypothetical protein
MCTMCVMHDVCAALQANQKNKTTRSQRRQDYKLAESNGVNTQASPKQQKTNTNALVPPRKQRAHTSLASAHVSARNQRERENGRDNSTRRNTSIKTHNPVLRVHGKKYENDPDQTGRGRRTNKKGRKTYGCLTSDVGCLMCTMCIVDAGCAAQQEKQKNIERNHKDEGITCSRKATT